MCVEHIQTFFVDKRITLQRILKLSLDCEVEGVVWINLNLGKDKMDSCCEYSNGPSNFIK